MEPVLCKPACLDGASLTDAVLDAFDDAAARCEATRTMQTGMVLASLFRCHALTRWSGVWPRYDRAVESLLMSDDDEHALASGAKWQQADLSEDLLTAISLLAALARRYAMNPVQPGALALALAATDCGSASRHLRRMTGYSREDLVEHIQSDLLGTVLDGFDGIAEKTADEVYVPSRLTILAAATVSAGCLVAAWQALLLVFGALTAVGAEMCVLLAITSYVHAGAANPSRVINLTLRISWSPAGLLNPPIMAPIAVSLAFLGYVMSMRHRLSSISPLGIFVGIIAVSFLILLGGFTKRGGQGQGSGKKIRRQVLPVGINYRILPALSAVITGGGLSLLMFLARLGFLSTQPGPFSLRPYLVLRDELTGSGLGGWFPLEYWPVLAGLAGAAAGYLLGSAIWAATLTQRGFKVNIRRHLIAAGLVATAVVAFGNLPISPVKDPAISGPLSSIIYRYPAYPNELALGGNESLSDLQWTRVGPSSASALAMATANDCSPNCAQGAIYGFPVKVTFFNPKRCVTENGYLKVTAYLYTEVKIRVLSDPHFRAPPGSIGRSSIASYCQ